MPELPEVETTVRELRKKVQNRTFLDVWTDFPRMIKIPGNFDQFKREIKQEKIKKIWRRGKNIIFELTNDKVLLIHQKLTGHLLYGKWRLINKKWQPENGEFLEEPVNKFLHLVFFLDNNKMLGLSDLRKFAKVLLIDKESFGKIKDLKDLGPEPLAKDFTLAKFKNILSKAQGKIKQVLMDQRIIAGIGNIYSDEILWQAKINPLREVRKLTDKEKEAIYRALQKILNLAIETRGESISDYRLPSGQKGGFDKFRKVYQRQGEKCFLCRTRIQKIKIGGRSAHFCPKCQRN